jgi:hypothetical protein
MKTLNEIKIQEKTIGKTIAKASAPLYNSFIQYKQTRQDLYNSDKPHRVLVGRDNDHAEKRPMCK